MKRKDQIALERYKKRLDLVRKSGAINAFETDQEKKDRIAKVKADIDFCVQYYFPHYAKSKCASFQINWANYVKRKKKLYGFCKWPRGHAKSVWNNVFIPFWLWLQGEDVYFVLIGQNADRAEQLLDDLRAEFEANPRIIADFGEQRTLGAWEGKFFITKTGFVGQALGLGQSCRGLRVKDRRPTLINVDDAETRKNIKNERIQDELVEWVEQELLPTMDNPDYERIMFSNNWFAPNMFLKKLSEKHPDWKVHEVKAYDPISYEPAWNTKYTAEYFRDKEKKMGISSARAEYLHEAKIIGKIFKEDETQWSKLPRIDHFKAIVMHWDIAYAGNPTSDYNAIRCWGLYNNNFYYIDGFVRQTKMKPAVEWLAQFLLSLNEDVRNKVIRRAESQFWNDEVKRIINEVEKEYQLQLKIAFVNTGKGNKLDRIISGLEAYWQNGRMYYNEKMKSNSHCQVGLNQLYGIEPGYKGNDDAPDADEQCIDHLTKYISYKTTEKNGNIRSGKVQRKNII